MTLIPIIGSPLEDRWWPDAICADPTRWTDKKLNGLKYIKETFADLLHWQLPAETVDRGGGSCADLSIAWLHKRFKEGAARDTLAMLINSDHAIGTDGECFYECRARRKIWRVSPVKRDDFIPAFRLQLDGPIFMIGAQ